MSAITFPPGPRNRFPLDIVLSLTLDTLDYMSRLARRYGDVVHWRIGRAHIFLLSHPDAIRDVLVTYDEHFTKGPALRQAKRTLGEGLLTSEGDLHRRQRRLAQPALHPSRMERYARVMVELANQTAEAWQDGQIVDMHQEMMRLTLRIVAKTLFDADVESDLAAISEAMDVMVPMFTRAMRPWGPLLNKLPLRSNRRFRRAHALLDETIHRFIREHRETGHDRGDLLSMLLRATDADPEGHNGRAGANGNGMSDTQLRDESYTMFTAGHETTANALTFAWYLLAQHPREQDALHEELHDVLGGRSPTAADLDKLPYTRAVVSETMRLFPPAWSVARQAKDQITIGGCTLPADSVVLMSQWVVHHDERWWPSPETFDPQRWMTESKLDPQRGSISKTDRPRYAYFPFGGGSRSCIGEAFAWTEAILLIATLAQRWKPELIATPNVKLQPTITLRPRYGIAMRLVPR